MDDFMHFMKIPRLFSISDLVWAGKHEYLVLDSLGRAYFVSSSGTQVEIPAVKMANTLAFDWLDQRLFWANDHGVNSVVDVARRRALGTPPPPISSYLSPFTVG